MLCWLKLLVHESQQWARNTWHLITSATLVSLLQELIRPANSFLQSGLGCNRRTGCPKDAYWSRHCSFWPTARQLLYCTFLPLVLFVINHSAGAPCSVRGIIAGCGLLLCFWIADRCFSLKYCNFTKTEHMPFWSYKIAKYFLYELLVVKVKYIM